MEDGPWIMQALISLSKALAIAQHLKQAEEVWTEAEEIIHSIEQAQPAYERGSGADEGISLPLESDKKRRVQVLSELVLQL